jgi:hypothetical protein
MQENDGKARLESLPGIQEVVYSSRQGSASAVNALLFATPSAQYSNDVICGDVLNMLKCKSKRK